MDIQLLTAFVTIAEHGSFSAAAEPLNLECTHFLDCIRYSKKPRSNGVVGLRVVRILEHAQRSLLNGGEGEAISW